MKTDMMYKKEQEFVPAEAKDLRVSCIDAIINSKPLFRHGGLTYCVQCFQNNRTVVVHETILPDAYNCPFCAMTYNFDSQP